MKYRLPALPVLQWPPQRHEADVPPSLLDLPATRLVSQGRAAIWWALKLLGVGAGERVLVPAYHCPTMIAPIVDLGARPLFFDLLPDGSPDLDSIPPAHRDARALLCAHYFGVPTPMARVRSFCDTHRIALIEDCCHAFFGSSDGRPIGSWGDFAAGSLPKFFPVREGGVLASARRDMPALPLQPPAAVQALRKGFDLLDMASTHARLGWLNPVVRAAILAARNARPASHPASENGAAPGAPSEPAGIMNPEDFSAARAATSLSALTHHLVRVNAAGTQKRRQNYRDLAEAFVSQPGCRPLHAKLQHDVVPYVFPLWVDRHPERIAATLREQGVPCYRWDRIWPGTDPSPGSVAAQWSHHVLQLPCHQSLSPGDLALIPASVLACIEQEEGLHAA